MKQDEEDANKVSEVISVWSDLHDKSDELLSFRSGRVASESTKQVLLTEK